MHLLIVRGKMSLCLTMDRFAAIRSDTVLRLEDSGRAEDRSRLERVDLPQSSFTERQSAADLQRCKDTNEDSSTIKYRRYGSRLGGVQVRHKRQVLQDMARPLKHWLYKHRDNPYPTKTEKVLLALGSHMTLVQVSNWFANARRRLKNTVRQPDLSWALRIKLYNKYIQGNAERLSVCSDDTESDDEECRLQTSMGQSDFGRSSSVLQTQGNSEDGASPPSKYKSGLLNRYLNDTLRHMMEGEAVTLARKRRGHSESFSSNECERDAVSPASSYETEANFVYRMDTTDYASTKCDRGHQQPQQQQQHKRGQHRGVDQGWREIHAAVALTDLAQGQSCTEGHSRGGPGASSGTGPFAVRRTTIIDMAPTCTAGPALTSRIIQKSSHISEVQTVNVALANTA